MPRKGFIFCRYCGKIQDDKGKIKHALTCIARDQETDKPLTNCVYLYREFSSEAIRILLPATTFAGSDRALHSFVAALQLGLKKKFAGKIDHLQTTVYEEPIPESTHRKRYLVLYDKVPGGTGYLKQLMRSEQPVFEVLDLALEVLRSCSCHQDPVKDGCYRCLFAYRSSYYMGETSRDTAVGLLSEIMCYRDRMVKTENLRNVSMNAVFGSELEARFIEAFRRLRRDDLTVALTKELVNGKPGYLLKIGERAYYIEPQVKLGPEDGVSIPSQADFVFSSARTQDCMKPIVVFTDGYLYHRDRIGQDMAQRMAIVQSNRFLVWTLTWKDVENRYNPQGDYFRNYLNPETAPGGGNFVNFINGFGLTELQKYHRADSFTSLIHFLLRPDEKQWQLYAFVHGLVCLDVQRFTAAPAVAEWHDKLGVTLPDEMKDIIEGVRGPCLYGLIEHQDETTEPLLKLFVVIEQEAVSENEVTGIRVASYLLDGPGNREKNKFDAIWNGYLRLYNFLQFLPYAFFVTRHGVENGNYNNLRFREATTFKEDRQENAWAEVFEVTEVEIHNLLNRLQERGWPIPEAGFELTSGSGIIIATAELSWPELKIALLQKNELGFRPIFEETGWRVYPLADVLESPDDFIVLYRK